MRRSTARDRLCLPRTPYLLTTLNFSYGDRSALIVTMSVLISVLATLKGLLRSRTALNLEVSHPGIDCRCCNGPGRYGCAWRTRTASSGHGCHAHGAIGERPS